MRLDAEWRGKGVDLQEKAGRSGVAEAESGRPSDSPPASPVHSPGQEHGTPLRELTEFLAELATALNRFALYPSGHPSQAQAASRLPNRLPPLLGDRGTLSLGVARNQLIIDGVATDPKHPLLRDLANRLRRHQLGAISFHKGVEADEMRDALRTLAREPCQGNEPLGLRPPEQLRAWKHVRLYPLAFDRLQLLEEQNSDADAGSGRGTRPAQLWLGLARAALAVEAIEDDTHSTDPVIVAKSIDEHSAEGYDQVVVGYFLQIAEELKVSEGGRDAVALRSRISRLLSTVRPETLRRLVQMGGDLAQRRRFILDASQEMELEAVIELVQAGADAEKQTLSDPMIRMLSKLAAQADGGATPVRSQADTALREQVQRLVEGWDLSDPNPEAYAAALQRLSRPDHTSEAIPGQRDDAPEPVRLVQMALEVGEFGPAVFAAVDRMVEQGDLAGLVQLVGGALADSPEAEAIWSRVGTPTNVQRLLQAESLDVGAPDLMVSRMGLVAADAMLSELVVSESGTTRRVVLERLARMGSDIGPLVVQHLEDDRWFVQRDMLRLLGEISWWPKGFSPRRFSSHPDTRVRREALKLRLMMPTEREEALCTAVLDEDEPLVRMALGSALH